MICKYMIITKADLHTHSNFSDGSDSVTHIIDIAKAKGLDAIAITDHDTMSHILQFPDDAEIKVIGGVEVSAFDPSANIRAHILGYNIAEPEIITELTQPLLEERNRNSERQADILIRLGYTIDLHQITRAGGKYLYKQHIMDWLVSTGQVTEMFGGFYQETFKNGGVCDFDVHYINACDAVRAIKKAGGLAVLAHPGQQRNFRIIPELIRRGLDGLELNHHSNSDKDKAAIRDLAGRYGLFLTGGSDYHGKYESRKIGDFLSEESGTKAICGM